jgi:hypothetical protein
VNTWRCQNRKCCGCVILRKDNTVVRKEEHTHGPNYEKCEAVSAVCDIKQKSLEKNERSKEIVVSVTKDMNYRAIICMSKLKSLKNKVTKTLNKQFGNLLSVCNDIPEILK